MLLRSVVRFPLDDRVKDRILAETNCNPLALLELPRGLSPTQLADGFGLVETQAVGQRMAWTDRCMNRPGGLEGSVEARPGELFSDRLTLLRAAARTFVDRGGRQGRFSPRRFWSFRASVGRAVNDERPAIGRATPPRDCAGVAGAVGSRAR